MAATRLKQAELYLQQLPQEPVSATQITALAHWLRHQPSPR